MDRYIPTNVKHGTTFYWYGSHAYKARWIDSAMARGIRNNIRDQLEHLAVDLKNYFIAEGIPKDFNPSEYNRIRKNLIAEIELLKEIEDRELDRRFREVCSEN